MSERGRLLQTGGPERVVCHVDADCFYAACERLREPALRGEPVVVGMGYEPGDTGGAVATASYEARAYGVESAQAISTALELLPRKIEAVQDPDHSVEDAGFYRPVDMEYYERVSQDVQDILRNRADVVRTVSIDEAYLDLSETLSWTEDIRGYGDSLKTEIESEVGVTVSIGIAPTMSAAKVASDQDKPDGLVIVEPGEVRSFFAPLDVEEIHGVGPVTARELRDLGIETAGELAVTDPDTLGNHFGERGKRIYRFARGEDQREVTPKGKPKSLSRESAFRESTADREQQRERVRNLAREVAERAQRRGVLYQTIGIKVVTPPFDVQTRAKSLPGPVEDTELLKSVALELLTELEGARIRKLGVRVSNLSFTDETQPTLENWNESGDYGDGGHCVDGSDDSDTTQERAGQRSITEYE